MFPSAGCNNVKRNWNLLIVVCCLVACKNAWAAPGAAGPRFEISFPAAVRAQPVTGRLFVLISRMNEPEVRLQSHWINTPEMLGRDVRQLQPGEPVAVDSTARSFPFASVKDLPPGDYYVQAVMNVYTEFRRADGHVIWAHMDQWEGQQYNLSPGNLHSEVRKLRIDASQSSIVRLSLTKVIPPVTVPADTQWVKRIRIQSKLLSAFWGRPMYLGAVVLLPRDYDANPDVRYPVVYYQTGHFSQTPPFGFTTQEMPEKDWDRRERLSAGFETGYEFHQSWAADRFPRMIAVSFQHPTPFADMSGVVNSPNNGPYGDAILTELIPRIEDQFRIIRAPYARLLTGKASGGRDAMTLQLHHPEFFGGAWVFHPWAFDFTHYFTLNIYTNTNAFIVEPADLPEWARNANAWFPLERYMGRTAYGQPLTTLRQLSQHDAVMATHAGGEFGSDDARHGPIGANGYPKPLWDRVTGRIDRSVVDYWREHGDLAVYAERNWSRIGPHLADKLHFYAGDMDHFERNHGLHRFEEFLSRTRDPHVAGTFAYAPLKGDWQPMTNAELIRTLADHVARNAPPEVQPPRLPQ